MTTSGQLAAYARLLAGYAKRFNAGAFATPSAADLAGGRDGIAEWHHDGEVTVAVVRVLTRPSVRRDFTGRPYVLPPGPLITHIARTADDLPLPDLSVYNFVIAHVEDRPMVRALTAQGRKVYATSITAASEILGCYGRGETLPVEDADRTTVAEVPIDISPAARTSIVGAVARERAWSDDFPYYSDGTWSAVMLRGFRPDDDTYGIKPAEMPKRWRVSHPEAMAYEPGWTPAATRHPTLVAAVHSVPWWRRLERVRLLRMAGRADRPGTLARHTDITDRSAGTRDGQIARFHLPLVTHPAVTMHAWELDGTPRELHLEPWRCYYLDARKPHAVTNASGTDRIHLVADVVVDARVRERLARAA